MENGNGTRLQSLFTVNGLLPVYSANQPGFALEAIPENYAYILDSTGWKLYKRNGVAISLININSMDGFPKIEESIQLTSRKIPLDLIRRVTAFFAAVYKRNKTEAVGYLYYHPSSGEWDFIPPIQTATSASCTYDKAPQKEGWLIAGTIHSHGNMSAFHSGTDHKDETFFDGVHITIGKLNDVPEYSCSMMADGARASLTDPSTLIDGMAAPDEVPDTWLDAVKLSPDKLMDDKVVGDLVEKLYDRYFAGKLTEKAYMERLDKLKEKADKDSPIVDTTKGQWFGNLYGHRSDGYVRRHGRWDY